MLFISTSTVNKLHTALATDVIQAYMNHLGFFYVGPGGILIDFASFIVLFFNAFLSNLL